MSYCHRGAMQDYDIVLFILALAKTVTPEGECPAGVGPAGWFLHGGLSRKARPIKHQLVLVCWSVGLARKNQPRQLHIPPC